MVSRNKRLKRGIQSLKKEIEEHFTKLENDIKENKNELGRYHSNEIEKSLLKALGLKLEILDISDNSLEKYKKRLEKLKKELDD